MWVWMLLAAAVLAAAWAACPARCAPGPWMLPLLGSPQTWVPSILRGALLQEITGCTERYGPVYQVALPGIRPYYVFRVADPGLMKYIIHDTTHFTERWDTSVMTLLVPNGMLALVTNDKWSLHRRLLTSIFSAKEAMMDFVDVMNAVADKMLSKIQPNRSNELHQLFVGATFDVIVEAAFGFQPNLLNDPNSKFSQAFKNVLRRTVPMMVIPKFIQSITGMQKRFEDTVLTLKQFVENARNLYSKNAKFNVFSALEQCTEDNDLPKDDIIDESITIMIGGHETTANTLSWASLLLAMNPDCQQKAFNEILQIIGKNGKPSFDLIYESKLPYIEAIVKESLRIKPSIPLFIRYCSKEVTVGAFRFPRGARIGIAVGACNLSSNFWENPSEFRPERFLGLTSVEERQMQSEKGFYPFGGGRRMCLGKKFAMMEAVLMLSRILQRYELKLTNDAPVSKGQTYISMSPEKGVHIDCIPRCKDNNYKAN